MTGIGWVRGLWRAPALGLITVGLLPLLLLGRALTACGAKRRGSDASHAAIRTWARGCLLILNVRVERSGEAPEPPFFLVHNHLSYLDILVLHAHVRGRFLSKLEISGWPIAGWLARLAGTLFIDRDKRRDVSRVIPEMQAVLAAGDGVMIFPEGTSSPGERILPFHPSLLQVPTSLSMPTHWGTLAYRVPAGSQPAFWSVCWWGDMPFGSHFLKLMALPRIDVALRFGSPPVRADDRKTLAARLHERMVSHFEPTAPPGTEALPIPPSTQPPPPLAKS